MMRRGLITTTIEIPYALELIAKNDDELQIFIAADEKTPEEKYGPKFLDLPEDRTAFF